MGGTPPSLSIGGTPPRRTRDGKPSSTEARSQLPSSKGGISPSPRKDQASALSRNILPEDWRKKRGFSFQKITCPPNNLTLLKGPEINPEILKAIPSASFRKDQFQRASQNQLGRGLTALGAGINIFLMEDDNKENKYVLLGLLSESVKLLADVPFNMSLTQRALIAPTLSITVKDLTDTAPIEEFLFGTNLSKGIKRAKAFERVMELEPKIDTFKKSNISQPSTSAGSSGVRNIL
ncbi:hypothetical protein JTB14_038407 [Gonioctena quinquepunctata]|nr:hypothetical protein JTB14_038407 [Gonioctena quinquepunctata]